MGSEILTITYYSSKTNILAITLKENCIKIINLFDSSFINEISGISLNKFENKNQLENGLDKNNFKKVKINKNKYLILFNEEIGKIQLINLKTGKITSNLNLIVKNFTSKTEHENINIRKLKFVEIIKPNNNLLVTYEEINLKENSAIGNKNSLFISYLKFWKISDFSENNFTLELLSIAENPHSFENLNGMISNDNKLITYSDTFFKVWDLKEDKQIKNFSLICPTYLVCKKF